MRDRWRPGRSPGLCRCESARTLASAKSSPASRAHEQAQLSPCPPSRRHAHCFGATSSSHPLHPLRLHDLQSRRRGWGRERRSDANDPAVGMIDEVELAIGVDAERADEPERGLAAQLGRVLASIRGARLTGSIEGKRERPDAARVIREEVSPAKCRPRAACRDRRIRR